MTTTLYDLAVIGGGINGCGIAADAARRGLRVVLFEADDLGAATSSASSKLIHGGLRYLEQYQFRLVREALAEREVLLRIAPHIVWPMRFVLPHVEGMRSRALLRLGLFLYDHLALRRTLGRSTSLDLSASAAGAVLTPSITHAFAYWDCWVDDARLVVLNAMAAREAGAAVHPRTPVTAVHVARDDDPPVWKLTTPSGMFAARTLINAAGPWAANVAAMGLEKRNKSGPKVRLVKGSHIVVKGGMTGPGSAPSDDAFILQHGDGRVIFALPFERDFTLIGTTDIPYQGDPRQAAIDAAETSYLLTAANRYFCRQISQADIVWSFAGVRPLDDDGADSASRVSRDYRLDVDDAGGALAVHVIGGKITTYRRLAAQAVDALAPAFPSLSPSSTSRHPLPGGDIANADFEAWLEDVQRRYAPIPPIELQRLARRYGTRIDQILSGNRGAIIAGVMREAELDYLMRAEWALTASDVLWRRTKLGLRIAPSARAEAASAFTDAIGRRSGILRG